jgi:hypothetical protein
LAASLDIAPNNARGGRADFTAIGAARGVNKKLSSSAPGLFTRL